jgi:hypothetical protein
MLPRTHLASAATGVLFALAVGGVTPGLALAADPGTTPADNAIDWTLGPACAPAADAVSAAGETAASAAPTSSPRSAMSVMSTPAPSGSPSASVAPEPETETGTAYGDVPDNAVFLTYADPTLGFSIEYVEGWQVTPKSDGVVIKDKDSSETVQIVLLPADVAACVDGSELPALQALADFALIGADTVDVNGQAITHLSYHLPSPPDPVTDKRVPSTVDRFYVPGPTGMAIVSLSTPDGVDNVDAFRQMIESLSWL